MPDWVRGFDVCLMPFALNEATHYINPTKTLEYMAAGKPIVSTAIADVVRQFDGVVQIARSHTDFIQAALTAVQPNADRIAEGVRRASEASWEHVMCSMRELIDQCLAPCQPADA